MVQNTVVYWIGIVGVAGKGPNWMEKYDPNRTIGDIIQTMTEHKLGENNKRIEIFKFKHGDVSKYDKNDPHWNHNTKLSEYLDTIGNQGNNVMLVYVVL